VPWKRYCGINHNSGQDRARVGSGPFTGGPKTAAKWMMAVTTHVVELAAVATLATAAAAIAAAGSPTAIAATALARAFLEASVALWL